MSTDNCMQLVRLLPRHFKNAEFVYASYYENKTNRKAMNRNRSNQKANPALKTKTGNK